MIGANGTALEIVEKVEEAEIVLGEMTFATDLVIVEGLTSEGILGLDFLERHQCIIDVSKGILTLSDGALQIPLQKKEDEGAQISQIVQVCLVDTVIVPPRSEVIVGASMHVVRWSGNLAARWTIHQELCCSSSKGSCAVSGMQGSCMPP